MCGCADLTRRRGACTHPARDRLVRFHVTFRPKAGDLDTPVASGTLNSETFPRFAAAPLNGTRPLFDGRGLQDRRQPRDLAPHQFGERLWSAPLRLRDLGAEIEQPLLYCFFLEAFVERLGELVDDCLRRAL